MLPPKTSHGVDLSQESLQSDGVFLDDLAEGTVVVLETKHHHYRLIKDGDSHVRISGHPTYCPEPVEVEIEASIGRGFSVESHPRFIGPGMRLVLKHPQFDRVTTSWILEIHKC